MKLSQVLENGKTTAYGILTFIALVANEVSLIWDGDPLTNPGWGIIVAALFALLGFGAAKDAITAKK